MSAISTSQILTVIAFLAVLGTAAIAVRLIRPGTTPQTGRRMRVGEVLALSPTDRAMILQVDGRDYLLVRLRGAPPMVTPLPEVSA